MMQPRRDMRAALTRLTVLIQRAESNDDLLSAVDDLVEELIESLCQTMSYANAAARGSGCTSAFDYLHESAEGLEIVLQLWELSDVEVLAAWDLGTIITAPIVAPGRQ